MSLCVAALSFLNLLSLVAPLLALTLLQGHCADTQPPVSLRCGVAPQPVVIDTDIGTFVDDFYAIGFALQSPYLDVKLIVTSTDDTTARAKILAKLLTLAGRDSIPVGIGVANQNKTVRALWDWAKDYNLSTYKGGVYEDGVGEMAKIILGSESVVDILAIAPMTNFPFLLRKYPDVVKKARIKAMAGSIYKGYHNSSIPTEEYNVKLCPHCAQEVLRAGWNITIAPLDTCGVSYLPPSYYEPFIAASTRWTLLLGAIQLFYCTVVECELTSASSLMCDTVGTLISLPTANTYVTFKQLSITVTDDGHTIVDKSGVPTQVALYWNNNTIGLDQYRNYMVSVISGMSSCNNL